MRATTGFKHTALTKRDRILSRLHHACDRLADMAVMTGRDVDLDFHQPFAAQHDTPDHITSGGAPMTTDPRKELAQCVSSVLAQAILTHEYSLLPHKRKHHTRFLRLTAGGDMDAVATRKI